jgi:nucleoside-diphosphate-sugar epimerase
MLAMSRGLIVVTGVNGFVGTALVPALSRRTGAVRGVVRRLNGCASPGNNAAVGDIGSETCWKQALAGADRGIHLAGRVHYPHDNTADSLAEFRKVNVAGTLKLAREAARQGARRFVFVSSIKVNGDSSRMPFTADDVPAPADPYAISKHEAEQGLRALAEETGLEMVIIRPPLVYGPGVKANFLTMLKWLKRRVPLPLGAIYNRRSLVALDNLVDLIITCLKHPAAANQTFLVSDGEDLSTTELLQRLGKAMGRPARLLPVPVRLLEAGAAVIGKREVARRLCGSLQVDISKARRLLGWRPPVSVEEGLQATARYFLESQKVGDSY